MFIHSVYFWLKPELTDEEMAAFAKGLRSLAAIESVKTIFIGRPAATDRPVVERGYTFALVVDLGDQAGHDTYAVHPEHLAFVERFKPDWTQINIYDFV